jgi:hypothetical protein
MTQARVEVAVEIVRLVDLIDWTFIADDCCKLTSDKQEACLVLLLLSSSDWQL